MRIIDTLTKAALSWFDLVFIIIVFTVTRDERVPSAIQTVIFVVTGAVVRCEHVWLRRAVERRREVKS